jgi:hypothetical protein
MNMDRNTVSRSHESGTLLGDHVTVLRGLEAM